ncbi:MAG: SBBP repeat-containing protein, partial [Caldilineales bacterium]
MFAVVVPATSVEIGSMQEAQSATTDSLLFIENMGQWPAGAGFQIWGGPGAMWLADNAIWITLVEYAPTPEISNQDWSQRWTTPGHAESAAAAGVNLKISFVGANRQAVLEPLAARETHVSYFLGADPAGWRPDVPVYGGVRYKDLYPGVDLILGDGQPGWMPWSLEQYAGADMNSIRLRIEGVDNMILDGRLLHIETGAGPLTLPLPAAGFSYQVLGTDTEGHSLVFDVAPDVTGDPPMTDGVRRGPDDNPTDLIYSTFLGGSSTEESYAVALDDMGSAFVAGTTLSYDFPTTPGAFDPYHNGYWDNFVAKVNPDGSALEYATFLGGDNIEYYPNIDVDGAGNAYITGRTSSSNFPTTPGAFDTTFGGGICGPPGSTNPCPDAYVIKLNPTGNALVYSTFLGGSNHEWGFRIVVDEVTNAFVSGETASSDFPTTLGAFDTTFGGGVCGSTPCTDAFVVKVDPAGSA